jgi:hypothetical protein
MPVRQDPPPLAEADFYACEKWLEGVRRLTDEKRKTSAHQQEEKEGGLAETSHK